MRFLKTNTATIVTVGPFYDKTDGVTIETGLTITNERITFVVDLNDGSAPTLVLDNVTGATSGTSNDLNYITNCDAGLMQLELAAANVNYLGRAMLTITDAANHVPVFHEFMILPANIYDSLVVGTDKIDVNVEEWNATSVPSEHTSGYPIVTVKDGTGTGEIDTTSGGVLVAALANGAITAASIADNAIDAGAVDAGVWTELLGTTVETQGTITVGQALQIAIAALAGVVADATTTPVLLKTPNGSATRITAAVDGAGNRTSITLNFS